MYFNVNYQDCNQVKELFGPSAYINLHKFGIYKPLSVHIAKDIPDCCLYVKNQTIDENQKMFEFYKLK